MDDALSTLVVVQSCVGILLVGVARARVTRVTAGQIDDVLGDRDRRRCPGQAADVGNRFTLPTIASRQQFEDELVAGQPGPRRVVLSDLVTRTPRDEACTAALTAAP
ncbi:hypothetical protein [Actinophytocola sp.]|uniref:hypothetical protein n=1 Tax=Actinophytocola sp. TaxID=1872138 RepID=UPI002ED24C92